MICDNCSRFVVHFMDYFFCHTLTFTYRNVLSFNMADDAVLLILQNHGERLTSIENDVHDIRTGIEQIKDSPIFAIERYVRRKVVKQEGLLDSSCLLSWLLRNRHLEESHTASKQTWGFGNALFKRLPGASLLHLQLRLLRPPRCPSPPTFLCCDSRY